MQVLACLTSSAREIRTPMLVQPLVPVRRSAIGAHPALTCYIRNPGIHRKVDRPVTPVR
jgi:hypothetical protein